MQPGKVKGIIPPIVTPVDKHENVDPGGLHRVIDHMLEGGVHGIFVLGSNGEFYAFDRENQKRAVEVTAEHVNGRVPVYAGTGSITTRECVRFAKMAGQAGADAITVLAPMYINPSDQELFDHFKEIADSTPLPVILYNNPARTTNHLSASLVKKLAGIENIAGIKTSTLDFSQSIRYLEATRDVPSFSLLSGSDYYIYATLVHGGSGAVAGTANAAPRLVVDIYDRFAAGDHAGALEAQRRLIPLRDAFSYGTFPVVMKECLNLMGISIGGAVKPVGPSAGAQLEALKKILRDLDLIS